VLHGAFASWGAAVSAWHGGRTRTGNANLVEVGLGAALLSKARMASRPFPTAFQFGAHLGAGVRFGQGMRYSNADTKKPDQGIGFNTLNFGFRFQALEPDAKRAARGRPFRCRPGTGQMVW